MTQGGRVRRTDPAALLEPVYHGPVEDCRPIHLTPIMCGVGGDKRCKHMTTTEVIRDRGRGPEIGGTRITVYNLLPHFLDPTATEEYICRMYGLTPEEVAAARAYVLNHADAVLAEHLRIEQRLGAGNPQHVVERAAQARETFASFRDWLAQRERAAAEARSPGPASDRVGIDPFPPFREWLAERESRAAKGP